MTVTTAEMKTQAVASARRRFDLIGDAIAIGGALGLKVARRNLTGLRFNAISMLEGENEEVNELLGMAERTIDSLADTVS